MKITTEDIIQYCNQNGVLYMTHGTTTDTIGDFVKDGLAVNPKNIGRATVSFWSSGVSPTGSRIVDYTWSEAHSFNINGNSIPKDCCVIMEVPKSVVNSIDAAGLERTQENIFRRICEPRIMTVPDCENTRSAYEKMKNGPKVDFSLEDMGNPTFGPKYCPYGTEPMAPFIGFGVPPKYILAICSTDEVFYASSRMQRFVAKRDGLQIDIPEDEFKQYSADNIDDEYLKELMEFHAKKFGRDFIDSDSVFGDTDELFKDGELTTSKESSTTVSKEPDSSWDDWGASSEESVNSEDAINM